jgi:syntaxin-binding protein 1
VEQNCATGLTTEGKTPRTLVEEMVPLLDSRDVINANKVRIIALYIQHRDGVPEEDRRRLYQHARLSMAEQDAVNAILHLGVRLSRGPGDRDTKKIKQKPSDDEYELSRFKPLLKTIIEDHVANKLDPTLFPYVKDSPAAAPAATSLRTQQAPATSLRSAKPSWHRAARPGVVVENRQRILVFIAGGMTYSEVREAYQLSTALGKDIYIGSTHTFTPRQFVDDLKVVDRGGVGSKAIPKGLPSRGRGQRPYQEYYDEKYFTPDAPPPPPQQRPPIAPHDEHGKLMKPSPVSSFVGSTVSESSSTKDGKKKKRGLFGF